MSLTSVNGVWFDCLKTQSADLLEWMRVKSPRIPCTAEIRTGCQVRRDFSEIFAGILNLSLLDKNRHNSAGAAGKSSLITRRKNLPVGSNCVVNFYPLDCCQGTSIPARVYSAEGEHLRTHLHIWHLERCLAWFARDASCHTLVSWPKPCREAM